MPKVAPAELFGHADGAWREWANVFVRDGGAWVTPLYVWARHGGVWQIVWASNATLAQSPTATLETDGTVTIDWDDADPKAVDSYTVRRSDGTLVATVDADGGPYSVVDTTPVVGEHPYTIRSTIGTTNYGAVSTNTVDFDLTPGTPTVTFVDVGATRVARLSWGSVVGGTSSMRIYRPNGFVAGLVPAATTTFDDTAPPANVDGGTYTIEALDNINRVAGSADSAPLEIATAPTNVNVTGTAPNITVSWDAITAEHTGIRVSFADGDFVDIAEGLSSYNWNPLPSPGIAGDVEVATKINGLLSTFASGGAVANPPLVPVSVTAVATGGVGQGRLTWGAPSGSVVAAYEVEWSDNGSTWNASSDDTSPVTITFGGSSGVRYFRVRSVGQGGAVSAWVTRTFTPQWDTTPPLLPSTTSFKPEASYGRLVHRFTIIDGSTAAYRARHRVNGGSWSTTSWITVLYGADPTPDIVRTIGTFAEGQTVDVQLQVRDQYLNESAWSNSWTYTLKAATQFLSPVATSHYRLGSWNVFGDDRPYQGYESDPAFNTLGAYFYGETAIADACNANGTVGGKLTVTAMKVTLVRRNTFGVLRNAWIGTMATFGPSGTPVAQNIANMGNIALGESKVFTLTAAQQAALVAGGSSGRAICQYVDGPLWMQMANLADNAFTGFLQIESLG